MKSKAVEYTLLGVGVTASLGLIFHNQIGTLMIKTYKPTNGDTKNGRKSENSESKLWLEKC